MNIITLRILRLAEEEGLFIKKKTTAMMDRILILNVGSWKQIVSRLFNHKIKIVVILLLVTGWAIEPAAAQNQVQITGAVTDAVDGTPMPGVNIIVKGMPNIGTSTDSDGEYSINVPTDQNVLIFSFVGFIVQEVEINGRSVVNVELQPDVQLLQDVIVVGYGTQRAEDNTSSVAKVSSEDFKTGNVTNPLQMIQGKVAGVNISNFSGDPNEDPQISLRGISSVNGNTEPLIVIDGVPGASLNSIAPEDIESFDILKDGSAAAIYGTRGTNGVILITTKKASRGEVQFDYNAYATAQKVNNEVEVLDAETFRAINAGTHPLSEVVQVRDFGDDFGFETATDWMKEIRRTPVSQVHNVTLRTGGENSTFVASGTFRNNEGLFRTSEREDRRGRLQYTQSLIDDMLRFDVSAAFAQADWVPFNDNIFRQALWRNPTAPIRNPDGTFFETGFFEDANPVGLIETEERDNESTNTLLNASVTIEPINRLSVTLRGSSETTEILEGEALSKENISNTQGGRNGVASREARKLREQNLVITAEYVGEITEDHRFTVLAGYDYQDFEDEGFMLENEDFPTDIFGFNNLGLGNGLLNQQGDFGSFRTFSKLIAGFGRVNYNFQDKYLINVSARREGSTRFGADNKWGWFPAVSGGWRASNEPFMEDVNVISDLRFRAGFGITGTVPTADNLSRTLLEFGGRGLINGEFLQGVVPSNNPNPDLRWEKKKEINVGADIAFLNDRVGATLDIFRRKTVDLLFNFPVPVPPNLFNTTFANAGSILNKGIEFSTDVIPVQTADLNWSLNVNFSYVDNELLSINQGEFNTGQDFFFAGGTGPPIQAATSRVEAGEPIGNFWTFEQLGLDENGQWIINDRNEDGVINEDDKFVSGNGVPDWWLGISSNVNYKNWDLSFVARGAFGHQIMDLTRMQFETTTRLTGGQTIPASILNTPGGDGVFIQDVPRIVDFFVQDADFLKIDNITLGYTLPIEIQYLRRARVYFSGDNLFTITGYDGVDPEVDFGGLSPGVDPRFKFPPTRSFTVGFELGF